MPWDDSDNDFFDGFTWGLLFSNMGCFVVVLICVVVALILWLT
jgi:hypothetical protein